MGRRGEANPAWLPALYDLLARRPELADLCMAHVVAGLVAGA